MSSSPDVDRDEVTPVQEAQTSRVFIGSTSGGASYSAKKKPLRPAPLPVHAIPSKVSRAQLVNSLIELIPTQLQEYTDDRDAFSFRLPTSVFEAPRVPLVKISSLFHQPDSTELESLVRNEDGSQKRLTPEMLEELRREATFSFPSEGYPPLRHVWRLPSWIQRGSVNIAEDCRRRLARMLDQFVVHARERLVGLFFSVRAACSELAKGLCGIVHLFVGIPKFRPKYHEETLFVEFKKALRQFLLRKTSEMGNFDMRLYSKKADKILSVGDYRFEGDRRAVSVQELQREHMEEAREVLGTDSDFEQVGQPGILPSSESSDDIMRNLDASQEFESENGHSILDDSERISVEFQRKNREKELERIEALPGLARIGDGVGRLARAEREADFVREDIYGSLVKLLRDRREEIAQGVKEEHPVLGISEAWTKREVGRRMRNLSPENGGDSRGGVIHEGADRERRRTYGTSAIAEQLADRVVEELQSRSDSLAQEAALENLRLEFLREHWVDIEDKLLKTYEPMVEVEHHRLRFLSYQTLERRNRSAEELFHVRKTKSDFFGWRIVASLRNAFCRIWNAVCFLTFENVWSGTFGLKALLGFSKFRYGRRFLGDSDPDLTSIEERHTLVTRLKAIWRHVRRRREEFESAPNTGFLAKDTVRWLHFITNYAVRGGVSSVIVAIMQPLLTALNVALSTFLIVLAPIWGAAWCTLSYLWSIIVYDSFSSAWEPSLRPQAVDHYSSSQLPRSFLTVHSFPEHWREYITAEENSVVWFPLLNYTFRIIFIGFGQLLLSGLGALIVHPMLGAVSGIHAITVAALRTCTDAFWRLLLLRFGRWPAADTWLAQRIAGPGISSEYFYRLNLQLLKKCIRAKLENIELDVVEVRINDAIGEPEEAFRLFCIDTTRHIAFDEPGSINGISRLAAASPLGLRLSRRTEQIRGRFSHSISARRRILKRLLDMPEDRNRIRPSGSPEDVVRCCVGDVEAFYETRLVPLGEEYTSGLWQEAKCPVGNMKALTMHLLTKIFCKDFLKSLEESDQECLQIPIRGENLLLLPGNRNGYQRSRRS